MNYFIPVLALALQGCAINSAPSQVPGFHPITAPANDTPQFRIDRQACWTEVEKSWAQALHENAAVFQFRQCLITKGYRLLS